MTVMLYKRYYAPISESFETVQGAIKAALKILDSDEAWPWRIEVDGKEVWRESGPLTTEESLRKFLEAQPKACISND